MQEILANHVSSENINQLREKIVLFNPRPHGINSYGTSIVEPICIDIGIDKIPSHSVFNTKQMGIYSLDRHDGEAITNAFDDNGPKTVINVGTWPSTIDEFGVVFYDYEFNKNSWDQRISQDWHENAWVELPHRDVGITNPGKTLQETYGSFEEYKQDTINHLNKAKSRYQAKVNP